MAKVAKKVDEGMQWLNTKMTDFQKTPLHKTPSVTPSQIYSEKKVIITELCSSVFLTGGGGADLINLRERASAARRHKI